MSPALTAALAVAAARSAALGAMTPVIDEIVSNDTFQDLNADQQVVILNALHAEIARVASGGVA